MIASEQRGERIRAAEARQPGLGESAAVRAVLTAIAVTFVGVFLAAPLFVVFAKAFEQGLAAYAAAVIEPNAVAAVRLTLITAAIVIPLNVSFGLGAAWSISRFEFRGRNLLITLIDVPFSVSPVISGLMLVLLFGAHGWLGVWLQEHGIRVIFALPGIVLATVFVTSPLVARVLIPLMRGQGIEEEETAITLGASGLQTFLLVSLPKVRWGLLYGVILCSARAIGEFGAVSVVSGHIRGETTTVPLHVEMLYNEYQFSAAFAVASLLTAIALVTLLLQAIVERFGAVGEP